MDHVQFLRWHREKVLVGLHVRMPVPAPLLREKVIQAARAHRGRLIAEHEYPQRWLELRFIFRQKSLARWAQYDMQKLDPCILFHRSFIRRKVYIITPFL